MRSMLCVVFSTLYVVILLDIIDIGLSFKLCLCVQIKVFCASTNKRRFIQFIRISCEMQPESGWCVAGARSSGSLCICGVFSSIRGIPVWSVSDQVCERVCVCVREVSGRWWSRSWSWPQSTHLALMLVASIWPRISSRDRNMRERSADHHDMYSVLALGGLFVCFLAI